VALSHLATASLINGPGYSRTGFWFPPISALDGYFFLYSFSHAVILEGSREFKANFYSQGRRKEQRKNAILRILSWQQGGARF
jgi:hypothetical protein